MTRHTEARKGATPSAGEVADRIHSAAIRLLRGLRRQDDKWGLSAPRLSALSVVVFGGPVTLGDLARAEQVRPPTMTRLVQALEAERLVRRTPDADDKRVVWIEATARGRRLLLRGRKARVSALAARLESLDAASVDTLDRASALLDMVARRL
ncbi:MAG TPA: MarR family transcriptional regulator [Gemmatimonadaceae bacterium]|nr:MarR family transcriptional regulator [Gemmatimonadaceae bacterium]